MQIQIPIRTREGRKLHALGIYYKDFFLHCGLRGVMHVIDRSSLVRSEVWRTVRGERCCTLVALIRQWRCCSAVNEQRDASRLALLTITIALQETEVCKTCSFCPSSLSVGYWLHQTTAACSKFGERAFSYADPRAWNQLRDEPKSITDAATFTNILRHTLIRFLPLHALAM